MAAHITAASPGGPRYDPSRTPEERRSVANGIWLCQNCAHLIDTDKDRFSVDILRLWKAQSEEAARQALETNTPSAQITPQMAEWRTIIREISYCLHHYAKWYGQLGSGQFDDIKKAYNALQQCASRVPGGKLMITAREIEDPSYTNLTVRITFKTKDGERKYSHVYNLHLLP